MASEAAADPEESRAEKIVDGTDVQFSESLQIEDREMFAHACKLRVEGVALKVRDGPKHYLYVIVVADVERVRTCCKVETHASVTRQPMKRCLSAREIRWNRLGVSVGNFLTTGSLFAGGAPVTSNPQ